MDAAKAVLTQQTFQDRAQGTNVGGIAAAFEAQHEGRSRLGSAAVTSGSEFSGSEIPAGMIYSNFRA
jgi:hypothetical protein